MQAKSSPAMMVQGRILNRAIEIEMILDNFLKKYYMAKTLRAPKHLERTVKHLPFRNKVEILSQIQVHLTKGRIPKSLVSSLEKVAKVRDEVCRSVQSEFLGVGAKAAKVSKVQIRSFDRNADLAMTGLLSMTRAVKRGKLI